MPSRRVRVLHVNLSPGGIGRYGALFAEALSNRDDVEILSIFDRHLSNSAPLEKIAARMHVVYLSLGAPTEKAKAVLSLRKILRDRQPDLVHDTAGSSHVPGVLTLAIAARKYPLVVTEHDPVPHFGMGTSLSSHLARLLVRRVGDHIFVHGPLGKEDLVKQGVGPSKVTVIRHGQLGSLFDQSMLEPVNRETRTVLFFGALRPNKGVELLVPIADRICKEFPDARFVVAGSSAVARDLEKSGWRDRLRAILDEMRKRPCFEVHDRFIPDEEVGVFFKRASITLMPYLDATQSGVAMIAMPLGSVVVATRVGDLPFTVEDGLTGYLAEPNIECIISKLSVALSKPADVESVRRNAKAWVEHECGWETITNRVIAAYTSLLSRM